MEEKVDIISIAFNKSELIRTQIRLIKKYFRDPYDLIIVDNSTNKDCSANIKTICENENIRYEKSLSEKSSGSMSHGLCLNWAYQNIIKQSSSRYFGTFDHDVFPIRPTNIIYNLKSGLYGVIQIGTIQAIHYWYLWPGFSFFDKQFIEKISSGAALNFCPILHMDTGGGNWPILYSKIDMSIVPPIKGFEEKTLRPGDCPQLANYLMIGDWLHMLNGSNWIPDEPGTIPKDDLIMAILKEFEGKND